MSEERSLSRDVTVEQLDAYLRNAQWVVTGRLRDVATIWNRQDDLDAEVVLPTSERVKDFRQRIKDALTEIATFEHRSVVDLISDIGRVFANVITVRIIHADTADGTIPINDGVLLIAKAKELLSAAAMAMHAKRKHFFKPTKEVSDYIDTLKLGQTEIGSYVVNVIAPLHTGQFIDGADTVPVAQVVTMSLVSSLDALTRSTEAFAENPNLSVFDAAVLHGASANMCDALLGLSGIDRKRSFEIKVTMSTGPMFEVEPRVFQFRSSDVESLQKAANYYRDDYVLEQRTLTGYVLKLSRPKIDSSGTITLDTQIGDVRRNVKIELSPKDYHDAVIAHDTNSLVQCSGDIHVRPKSASLLKPSGFRLVEVGDLL